MSKAYNTVTADGIKVYNGPNEITKGNHNGMPMRDDSYLGTDERGHIQASSLGGDNSKENIAPQAKDLNHGAYLSVENGEREALTKGNTVVSEKIAYSSVQPGNRPDAYMVNDTVTNANGKSQEVHHSFANMMNSEQESLNAELGQHSDLLDDPNPGDSLRENMSVQEYSDIMEKTDMELPNIQDEYGTHVSITPSETTEANNMWADAGYEADMGVSTSGNEMWDMAASDEAVTDASDVGADMGTDADCSADME